MPDFWFNLIIPETLLSIVILRVILYGFLGSLDQVVWIYQLLRMRVELMLFCEGCTGFVWVMCPVVLSRGAACLVW